jgi:dynein heavy chain
LSSPPETLDNLGDSLDLLDTVQQKLPLMEKQFEPLQDQFNMLTKYEVAIPEAIEKKLYGLNGKWLSFQQCLIDSDQMLKKHKEKFKTGLLHSAEEFKKTISSLVNDFETNGPFTSHITIPEALQYMVDVRQQMLQLKVQEESIRRGLNIFKIDQPPSNVIVTLEKDIENLEVIWELGKEWETSWNQWKVNEFSSLQTESMIHDAQAMLKRLAKLMRETKVKLYLKLH